MDCEQNKVKLIEIRHVEVYRLSQINEVAGTFVGQIYVEMAFPGGASDEDLTAINPEKGPGAEYFPFEPDPETGKPTRKPTFKPNAEWYLAQFEFDNLSKIGGHMRDAKVKVVKEDIIMQLYVEGEFHETLELQHFPYDTQDLTFVLAFNVRADQANPLACQLLPQPGCTGVVAETGFYLDHQWIHERYRKECGNDLPEPREVLITQHNTGHVERAFQTVYISVKVRRRPGYYAYNVFIPAHAIAFFAAAPLTLSLDEIASRTEIVVGLLIAFQLFKYNVLSNMMPHVSYETLLDKSIDYLTIIVWLITFENLVMTAATRVPELNKPSVYFDALCPRAMISDSDGCTVLMVVDMALLGVTVLILWPLSIVYVYLQRHRANQRGSDIEEPGSSLLPAALGGGREKSSRRLRMIRKSISSEDGEAPTYTSATAEAAAVRVDEVSAAVSPTAS